MCFIVMVHTMLDKFSVFNTTIILTHNQIIKLNWFDISDKKKRGLVSLLLGTMAPRRNSRYRRSNQNPQIKEGQTPQWSKEKEQKDKQRSTKHTHKTKDREIRAQLKTMGELRCSGMVSSSCSLIEWDKGYSELGFSTES
jgi:hypothetical protein